MYGMDFPVVQQRRSLDARLVGFPIPCRSTLLLSSRCVTTHRFDKSGLKRDRGPCN